MTLCHFQKVLDFLIEFSVGNTKEGKKRRALEPMQLFFIVPAPQYLSLVGNDCLVSGKNLLLFVTSAIEKQGMLSKT